MDNNFKNALKFWDQVFELDDNAKEEYKKELSSEDWKSLAPSEKLADVLVRELASKEKVLDYGCGEGWAGIILNKSGCKDVTSVDVVDNAIKMADFLKSLFDIGTALKTECVPVDYLSKVDSQSYDGIFCGNVIDVLPADISQEIISNFSRIARPGATIIVAMNYYAEPVSNPEKGIEVKSDNEIYVNGILRMVTRTDDEWAQIFKEYFEVEKIEYFAWPGETEEKRRIFIIKKR